MRISGFMAEWQSGYAAACKAVDAGSIPTSASIFLKVYSNLSIQMYARVVELVDTRDLKSLGFTAVTVRVRLRAPFTRLQSPMFKFSVSVSFTQVSNQNKNR